jgi:hypothetical protein
MSLRKMEMKEKIRKKLEIKKIDIKDEINNQRKRRFRKR